MKKLAPALISIILLTSLAARAEGPAPATANPYLMPPPSATAAPAGNPFVLQIPGVTLPNLVPYLGLLGWASTQKPSVASKPYEMAASITRQEKKMLMQAMAPIVSSLGIRDVMRLMSTKYKAKEGLSFDDVVEAMELRANQLNFKRVGHSPMWKDVQVVLGDMEAPRMEVFHYCDIAAGREVLKATPEAIVYLPCRIAIMEDANKAIWVMTLDWDMAWLDSVQGSMGINPALSKFAVDIRDKMDNIMQAAANGDL